MQAFRLFAAMLGLLLPLVISTGADAAQRNRHHAARPAAHVRTATYRVLPHKPRAPRLHTARQHRNGHIAQAPRHAATRRG